MCRCFEWNNNLYINFYEMVVCPYHICFLFLLKALFHIPAMANWLLEDLSNHTQRCEANSSNASYCSVCAMMRTLRQTLDRSNNVIKPSLIHHKLKSKLQKGMLL